ncbi:MAG TPA: aldehyde dehydrogenase family protein [Verrucomicrobiae bacterium]|nr:aldehyde dehydrogenase family protein [Verrucomicrobiae bacterium]
MDHDSTVIAAHSAFLKWRDLPAPRRGEIVRELGDAFRREKAALGRLVSQETGKILSEGLGEVQEVIDICDFAVGLSRQLHGLSMHSERPQHRMYEQWHPLGPIAVITAFNFPVAVWAWNAMIAAVCGDSVVWKPSEKAPRTAAATHALVDAVMAKHGHAGVFQLLHGGAEAGAKLAADARLPLVSFTGSVRAGREVAQVVARRLGRTLLELGGNNAIIVMDDARLELAVRAIAFGAAGTAGQRCTSTRRLFVQRAIAPRLFEQLTKAYRSIRIGDPLADGTLMGPLIDDAAVVAYERAIATAVEQGGRVLCGGKRVDLGGHYVEPTLIASAQPLPISREETFAPILYAVEFDKLEDAIAMNNAVPQGLSSAIFTESLRSAETFLSATGSDCGIANVNIGTSGAEIGGAFGGEKDTGGGRESGSDAWKSYMRRQTCTINHGTDLPLAQGVKFDL